ncbi:hypothetical protein [Streptomyces sp. ISL-11]|uniref:hypothetical protein n=1 Tax=Streptomyces sp. ISL-11 TaxID=2819174 RepID=UPI001BEC1842|nr:hypothetical protein [Streptomyces sp. ISL-11]MBT2384449.1 hypothetical protein [Streptomyces sp. ISL-11]
MKKPCLRVLTLAVVSLGALAPSQAPSPLRAGTPVTLCLTDASAAALRAARIELAAVAPATLVSENGHPCVRTALATGRIDPDLSGPAPAAGGGFAFHRGQQRATFEDLAGAATPDRTLVTSAVHHGRRIDVFSSPSAQLKLFLTKVSAADIPMNLTRTGAAALAKDFTTSPLPANSTVFTGTADFDVLNQVADLLSGE